MINLKTLMKSALVGAVMAMFASSAFAVTLNVGDSGSSFDVLADDYQFQDTFTNGTPGGNLTFTFQNNSLSTAVVTLSSATINQLANAYFTGGASVFWTNSGLVTSAAQGVASGGNLTFVLAAGFSDTLNVQFGNVVDVNSTINPDIDFFVSASVVPVPAAGLLLLTALGGLGLARRRRKAA